MGKSKHRISKNEYEKLAAAREKAFVNDIEQLKLDEAEETQLATVTQTSQYLITDKSVYYRSIDESKNRTVNIKDITDVRATKSLSKYGIKSILTTLAITMVVFLITLVVFNIYTENRELRSQYYDYVFSTPSASLNNPALIAIDNKDTVLFFVLAASIIVSVLTAIISIIRIIITCQRELELYAKIKYKKGSCKIETPGMNGMDTVKKIQEIILLYQR